MAHRCEPGLALMCQLVDALLDVVLAEPHMQIESFVKPPTILEAAKASGAHRGSARLRHRTTPFPTNDVLEVEWTRGWTETRPSLLATTPNKARATWSEHPLVAARHEEVASEILHR